MYRMQTSGFSLLEMLAVISIFLILGVVSVIAWNSAGPGMILNSAAQGLSNTLDLCILKARTERTEYFVVLNYRDRMYFCTDGPQLHFPPNSYVLVRDDGWLQTGKGTRQYNDRTKYGAPTPSNVEFAEEWVLETDNASVKIRHNNMIERRELLKGPLKLGRGINFQSPPDVSLTVRRIVFSFLEPKMYWQAGENSGSDDNKPISDRKTGPAKIYLSNQFYKIGVSTKDNKAHLRIIRATDTKIETFSPE